MKTFIDLQLSKTRLLEQKVALEMQHVTIEKLKLEVVMEEHVKIRSVDKKNINIAVSKRKQGVKVVDINSN